MDGSLCVEMLGSLFLFPLLLALSVLLGLGLRKSRIGKTGVAERVALEYFIHCCLCPQALPAFAPLGRGLAQGMSSISSPVRASRGYSGEF